MTRKDYNTLAATLRKGTHFAVYQKSADARSQHALMCSEIAQSLHYENENFGYRRFLLACGLDDDTIDAI